MAQPLLMAQSLLMALGRKMACSRSSVNRRDASYFVHSQEFLPSVGMVRKNVSSKITEHQPETMHECDPCPGGEHTVTWSVSNV